MESNSTAVQIHKLGFTDIVKMCKLYCNLPIHVREVFHPFPYPKGKFITYLCWIFISTNLFPIVKRVVPRLSYYLLIASDRKEKDVLGFIYFSLTGKEYEGYIANVGIITKEEVQGKGIGSKMYQSLIRSAKANGVSKFRVTVMQRNGPSTEQVKRLGYVCKGYTDDDYWNKKRETNLMWELDLKKVLT